MLERTMSNIEIKEEKSIKNTLMYVRNLDVNEESYETKVLLEGGIEHILKPRIIYEGENRTLLFDVSNTSSLEEFLKISKLSKENICDILDQLDEVLSSIENYLISENSICLDLKGIRVVKKRHNRITLSFAALPNLNSNFSYELSRFLIKILRYVDINDKEALSLAYSLFIRSSRDNYTLCDLMELVDAVRGNKLENLREADLEAINAYDEEIANEIKDEEIDEDTFVPYDFDEQVEEPFERTVRKQGEKPIQNIEKVNEYEDGLLIDSNTKDIINDTLFDSFDDGDDKGKKVIKFKKKLFNFRPLSRAAKA